jgi:hypothetical protein
MRSTSFKRVFTIMNMLNIVGTIIVLGVVVIAAYEMLDVSSGSHETPVHRYHDSPTEGLALKTANLHGWKVNAPLIRFPTATVPLICGAAPGLTEVYTRAWNYNDQSLEYDDMSIVVCCGTGTRKESHADVLEPFCDIVDFSKTQTFSY